ncbi:hypothetical protein PHMEG_00035568 [Phytophthora megakarya]|uniref:CCHC-type domain-containing protein n=1 Tax=Phytophthora megakarya TaxID=4795 RepID=A0A225UN43_9STRA|nr:hypothetical protein PHMEG_00035568 [Phytophthora megakarya]
MLDYFVKDTLLRGAKVVDAERMCDLPTGKEMWEDLEAHHTTREFSNYVWVMKKFFHATYTREQTMDSWLQEIHDTRRALANLGRFIDNDLTVDVILMGVVHTHRAVVRQFSRIMTHGSRPTLQQVLNTLKSETEIDEIVRDEEDEGCKIMHETEEAKTTGRMEVVSEKVCYYCGKEGHFRNVCHQLQFDIKHGTVDESKMGIVKSAGDKSGGGGGKNDGPKRWSFTT